MVHCTGEIIDAAKCSVKAKSFLEDMMFNYAGHAHQLLCTEKFEWGNSKCDAVERETPKLELNEKIPFSVFPGALGIADALTGPSNPPRK